MGSSDEAIRKSVLLVGMLCLACLNFGQGMSFPTADASWCYSNYGDYGEELAKVCFEFDAEKKVIQDLEYGVIRTNGVLTANEVLYFREENNKVFLLPDTNAAEILLYDFNLELGDIYETSYGWGLTDSISMTVQNISETEIEDGSIRKEYYLRTENGSHEITWLEGIGDPRWLFYFPAYVGSVSGGYSLLCHVQSGALVLSNNFNYCSTVNNTNINTTSQLKISPNPFHSQTTIELSTINLERIEIYNILGQKVWEMSMENLSSRLFIEGQTSLTLDLEFLRAGTYHLMLFDQERNEHLAKIIKL